MKMIKLLESKWFLIVGFFVGALSLIFGNMDSVGTANSPTSIEELFNYTIIFLIFLLGFGLREIMFSNVKLLNRGSNWPTFVRVLASTTLVLFSFAILSVPALALRQSIDPSFKSQHLQVQIDLTAATEKAATEKAATEKAATEKAATEKAATEKAATEKAATEKATNSPAVNQNETKFSAQQVKNFKVIMANIRSYLAALDSGNSIRASQFCSTLDQNYSTGLQGIQSSSTMPSVQEVLDHAKDEMYFGIKDCAKGFKKNRTDLIGQSVTEFVAASKYVDGLILVSSIK